jgi:tetratricopeptide (TPR) repeat protein
LAGCDDELEINDRNFVLATQHVRGGLYDDAIRCLNAVIRKHGVAPEASLLLGTIYLDKKNDPISAIYFLKKYLDECDDDRQKKIAEQLIDTAKKEFLKNLPAYNGIPQSEAELMEILKALRSQNSALSSQIASQRKKIADCETKIDVLSKLNTKDSVWKSVDGEVVAAHIVEPGETLSSISNKYYGTPNLWQKIFEANKSLLVSPENLKIGQELVVPYQ